MAIRTICHFCKRSSSRFCIMQAKVRSITQSFLPCLSSPTHHSLLTPLSKYCHKMNIIQTPFPKLSHQKDLTYAALQKACCRRLLTDFYDHRHGRYPPTTVSARKT